MTHTPNSQGIDTIGVLGVYATTIKSIEKKGFTVVSPSPNSPVSDVIKKLKKETLRDTKTRYKADKFRPVVEVVKLTKGKSVSNYMIIIRNTPFLFDHAIKKKKSKDTYCMILFTGLHQPTKKIESEAMKIISQFLKIKNIKLCRLDIAKDLHDPRAINKEGLKGFKEQFKSVSSCGVRLHIGSYYINRIEQFKNMTINYYDKYKKAKEHKENVCNEWSNWKRLEITLTFDVTKPKSLNFREYIKSMDFLEDISNIEEVLKSAKIKNYGSDYLIMQINSLLDNRFMNNNESMRQFNSVKSLEYFKESEFRRYVLPI